MRPHILIAEDVKTQREDLENYIRALPKEQSRSLRIVDFDIVLSSCAADAKDKLLEPVRQENPFDLLLLDLNLPEHKGGRERLKNGFEVLEIAQSRRAAKETVIVSGYLEMSANVLQSVRGGAADLFYKQTTGDELQFQEAVLRSLRRTVARDSSTILEQRIKNLVPYAERGLVYHLGLCFSRSIQEVGRAGDAIRGELRERLGLDMEQDKSDLLLQQLGEIERSLQNGRQEWVRLQAALGLSTPASSSGVSLTEAVAKLEQSFEPALITKNAVLNATGLLPAKVLSFNGDGCAVLPEMILGGLAGLPEFTEKSTELTLFSEVHDDWLDVTLRDNLPQFERNEARNINEGFGIGPDPRFSRAWGLSVMQQVALRGGGRLTVDPSGGGNTIEYRIPRARNG